MEYPLSLSFKVVALAPQLSVTDASGNLLYYVKQKLLKLKEEVTVFGDREQTQARYKINADRVIDFSARYRFTEITGTDLGAIKRQGMKSLWRARYDIYSGEEIAMAIAEEDPWIRVADMVLTNIPVVGLFAGYLFNPKYLVTRTDGTPVMRLVKQPALFESRFTVEKLLELGEDEERRVLLSLLMMVLLERSRG